MDWTYTFQKEFQRPIFWPLVRTPPEKRDPAAIEGAQGLRRAPEDPRALSRRAALSRRKRADDRRHSARLPRAALDAAAARASGPAAPCAWFERLCERPAFRKTVDIAPGSERPSAAPARGPSFLPGELANARVKSRKIAALLCKQPFKRRHELRVHRDRDEEGVVRLRGHDLAVFGAQLLELFGLEAFLVLDRDVAPIDGLRRLRRASTRAASSRLRACAAWKAPNSASRPWASAIGAPLLLHRHRE